VVMSYAKAVFGQSPLPPRCMISAGAYIPSRAKIIRAEFDSSDRPRGSWIKFTNATKNGNPYLVCFNVYGSAVTLELLHILKDGNASAVFFIGSMWARNLDVGTLVLPDAVIDRAGIVLLDQPGLEPIQMDPSSVSKVESVLKAKNIQFVKGQVVSVPSVLHDVKQVKQFVDSQSDTLGVEMELSTFNYFGRKLGLTTYALLYVQDNPKHGIISGPRTAWEARRKALRVATNVALNVL
jgi:purine-nucleoside phosphorylase